MALIRRATIEDAALLATLGRQTFIESHGHSGPKADVDAYIDKTYDPEVFHTELTDSKNKYHIIYYEKQPVGFSKIILDSPNPAIGLQQVSKLERIYLLQAYHHVKLGAALFEFNLELSKAGNQAGMWLYVWKENPKAIRFYTKYGFTIIGSHDFKLSEMHYNPNHLMFVQY